MGLVINAATITNTPLNGGLGITELLALAPGVQGAGSQDQIPVYSVTFSANTGTRVLTADRARDGATLGASPSSFRKWGG